MFFSQIFASPTSSLRCHPLRGAIPGKILPPPSHLQILFLSLALKARSIFLYSYSMLYTLFIICCSSLPPNNGLHERRESVWLTAVSTEHRAPHGRCLPFVQFNECRNGHLISFRAKRYHQVSYQGSNALVEVALPEGHLIFLASYGFLVLHCSRGGLRTTAT